MNDKASIRVLCSYSDNLKSKIQKRLRGRKWAGIVVLVVSLTVAGAVAQAQQQKKVPRIGYLSLRAGIEPREEAFRRGLRELGYIEGSNLFIDWRFAGGKEDLLVGLAAETVRQNVDVIVAAGTQATRAAKQATHTIPIVIGQVGDPVQLGLVSSLARPGGNITGVSTMSSDLAGKRLEILKESFPKVSRVAFLQDPRNSVNTLGLKETEAAAHLLGVKLQSLEVRRPDELDSAFEAARKGRADALIETAIGVLIDNQARERIAKLQVKMSLPVMHSEAALVLAGGLMSYATDLPEQFRRAATYVDKILKGTKPADLPVEQPMKFEFIVNLKTAKQIGVTIPPNILARADKVIR
jgi:putative tryptophan/tyrosine transport system substrate-binding protein